MFSSFLHKLKVTRNTFGCDHSSDVKRGQNLEAEAETKDKV